MENLKCNHCGLIYIKNQENKEFFIDKNRKKGKEGALIC
jgi:hypothetical protein